MSAMSTEESLKMYWHIGLTPSRYGIRRDTQQTVCRLDATSAKGLTVIGKIKQGSVRTA